MTKIEQIHSVFLADEKTTMRIKKSDAQDILLNNRSLIVKGNCRYFIIRDLGLGVCEIGLRDIGKVNTFFTKEYWIEETKWTIN